MPSVVSSSSTSAWARVQSPFASHQSAASGGANSLGEAACATDDLNCSGVIVCSDLCGVLQECNNKRPFSNVKWKVNGHSVILAANEINLKWLRARAKLPTQKFLPLRRASCSAAARSNLRLPTLPKRPE